MITKIGDWKKQANISSKIKSIKRNNGYGSIDRTLKEIEQYYEKEKYQNIDLLHRLSRLEGNMKIYELAVGTLMGILLSAAVVREGSINIVTILTTVIMAVIVSIIIMFLLNYTWNAKRGYENYISEKEVKIIKRILDDRIRNA